MAQSAFSQNLRAWKITPPRYLRGWYRELSFEEYNSEFDGVPRVLGRQLQWAVSYTVGAWLIVAKDAVRARDKEAHARAKRAKAKEERGERFLREVDRKLMREMFEVFAPESRKRSQDKWAKKIADYKAMRDAERAAEIKVVEDRKKAEADYAELMKCPAFREKVHLAKIAEEKKLQAKNVAYHAAEKEKKKEVHLARIAEEKKLQEANVAPEKETKKRRIEQIREWP